MVQRPLARVAPDLDYRVIFVSISIDASRFSNGQLGHLGRLATCILWHHLDVQNQRILSILVMNLGMLGTATNQCLQANIQSLGIFRRRKAFGAFIFINHSTYEVVCIIIWSPMRTQSLIVRNFHVLYFYVFNICFLKYIYYINQIILYISI